MARFYPAMKLKMGTWDYYMCKMSMRDISAEISFADDVSEGKSINEAIQRELGLSRAKIQIVSFLQNQEERFFNSLVVAALGGEPTFTPIDVNDPRFELYGDLLQNTFGMLRLNPDADLKLYALDGQHRLKAIQTIIEENSGPSGFSEETMSVAFVIPPAHQEVEEFRKSYRRLFSNLNRHAKPTSKLTNIIMDEDDRFAIITRRLVTDFEFFQWDGLKTSIQKVDTNLNSENISSTNPSFCGLINLYKMNIYLLWDQLIMNDYGAGNIFASSNKVYQDQASDEEIDNLYEHLERVWDALIITIPDLNKDAPEMRNHSSLEEVVEGTAPKEDSLLFWPIGQYLMARLARRLMNERGIDRNSSAIEISEVLKPLSLVPWSLRHPLWLYFLLIPNEDQNMIMANEQATQRVNKAYEILLWLVGEEDLNEDLLEEMQDSWASYLMPNQEQEDEDATFEELAVIRESILAL